MGRRIEPATWLRYERLREGGMGRRRAAYEVGISYTMAAKWDHGEIDTDAAGRVRDVKKVLAESKHDPPKGWDELSDVARRAVEDFDFFRARYFGREAKPWQAEAARIAVEREATELREWLVVNVPPGTGKSTTFVHDIPAWMITRGRVLRGAAPRTMIGSRTQRQANQYGRRLRTTFMRTRPTIGASGVLVDDFGLFQPSDSSLWRSQEFIVWENPDEQPTDEKEPTVMCAGMDTGFLGGRFDVVAWDDLVDKSTIRTESAQENQQEWFDDEAETRLEPGGLFMLVGQRLSTSDLYRYALDKPAVDDDGFEQPGLKKYTQIKFPGHFEDRCAEDHGRDATPYPDGCLLDPVRLSWTEMMTIKANNPRRFEILIQQEDVDEEGALVPKVFVDGGMWNGMDLPGCRDWDRSLGQLGVHHDRLISVMSVDPSPTKFWSIQWWVYDEDTQLRWLMDLHRDKMDAPDFLDRDSNGVFVGLADKWVQRAQDVGLPITAIVVEQNAAQRFLLQYSHVQDWMTSNGVAVIPHDTGGHNKADEDYGVQTLRPHYMFGRIRLPCGDPYSESVSKKLVDEVTVWPNGRTDDCVMSQWMFEWNLPNLEAAQAETPTRKVPSWLS